MHSRTGDNSHMLINRIELGEKAKVWIVVFAVLAMGIGAAFGLSIHAASASWNAEREARLAQYGESEFRKEQFFPYKAETDARIKALEDHIQALNIRLELRKELGK